MFRENKWFQASVKILKNCANSRAQPQNAKHLGCVCIYTERDKLKEKLVIMIIYHSKMLFILNKVWLSFLYHEYLSCCYYGIVFGNNKIYHFLLLALGYSYEGNKHCIRFYIEPIFKSILIQVNIQYDFLRKPR